MSKKALLSVCLFFSLSCLCQAQATDNKAIYVLNAIRTSLECFQNDNMAYYEWIRNTTDENGTITSQSFHSWDLHPYPGEEYNITLQPQDGIIRSVDTQGRKISMKWQGEQIVSFNITGTKEEMIPEFNEQNLLTKLTETGLMNGDTRTFYLIRYDDEGRISQLDTWLENIKKKNTYLFKEKKFTYSTDNETNAIISVVIYDREQSKKKKLKIIASREGRFLKTTDRHYIVDVIHDGIPWKTSTLYNEKGQLASVTETVKGKKTITNYKYADELRIEEEVIRYNNDVFAEHARIILYHPMEGTSGDKIKYQKSDLIIGYDENGEVSWEKKNNWVRDKINGMWTDWYVPR